jgi:hypothetical protein
LVCRVRALDRAGGSRFDTTGRDDPSACGWQLLPHV